MTILIFTFYFLIFTLNKTIHRTEALRLLEDGRQHRLRLWKLQTGEILLYPCATCISRHVRGGIHRLRLSPSGEVRALRDVCLFEIDNKQIYW